MATPSLKWDASSVSLIATTAGGGRITMSFPSRATDVSFTMPITALINPMTTAGDVIVGQADGVAGRLGIGTNGQVLSSNGTAVVWATLAYMTNPMSASGDIIYGGVSGTPTRLAKGSDDKVLTLKSGVPSWETASVGMSNPMSAEGDVIYGGTSGAPTALAHGDDGDVLTLAGGIPSWAAPTGGGMTNPMSAEGDIIYGGTAGAPTALTHGDDGDVLTLASGVPTWSAPSGGSGLLLQDLITVVSGNLTTTSTVTDSAPTITQGREMASITITPSGAGKRIVVKAQMRGSLDSSYNGSHLALFKNSDSACLTYSKLEQLNATWSNSHFAIYVMTTSDTTPITFSARGGSTTSGTFTIKAGSYLEVQELSS